MNRTTALCVVTGAILVAGIFLLRESQLAGQAAKDDPVKDRELRKIHTSGSATVRIRPNRARIFLAVETLASTVKDSRGENKKHMEKVIAAIQDLKIPDLKMKTTNVQMDVVHSKDEKQVKLPEILGYRTTTTFTVLVAGDDVDKLSNFAAKVMDTALENGTNTIDQVVFFRDDLSESKRQALTKATADAVANAKALAAGDNRTVLDVINIDGSPQYMVPSVYNAVMIAQDQAGDSTSLVAGEVEVTCRVNITCVYGPSK